MWYSFVKRRFTGYDVLSRKGLVPRWSYRCPVSMAANGKDIGASNQFVKPVASGSSSSSFLGSRAPIEIWEERRVVFEESAIFGFGSSICLANYFGCGRDLRSYTVERRGVSADLGRPRRARRVYVPERVCKSRLVSSCGLGNSIRDNGLGTADR